MNVLMFGMSLDQKIAISYISSQVLGIRYDVYKFVILFCLADLCLKCPKSAQNGYEHINKIKQRLTCLLIHYLHLLQKVALTLKHYIIHYIYTLYSSLREGANITL